MLGMLNHPQKVRHAVALYLLILLTVEVIASSHCIRYEVGWGVCLSMCFKISQLNVNRGQTMEGKALSCATFILGKCADLGGGGTIASRYVCRCYNLPTCTLLLPGVCADTVTKLYNIVSRYMCRCCDLVVYSIASSCMH